ncbi:HK97 family phage prohead protease [Flavobacterium sp. ARAG 55.4]|uniref:HK97 family phage prohead protease n=1 Tax=Flavobacterium sp. ARAG 55.4 TaxID=3451357 RepID=UPI003F6E0F58
MTYDFIINTENVNEFYYRVLTDGIDYTQYMRNPVVLFMHEREFQKNADKKGTAVIGRCLKLWKKGTDLVATIEFDMDDEFAAAIAGKVDRGYIRMASMFADVKATTTDPDLVLPGQLYETVTKCKLVEISIVDIGGNDGAIRLSRNGGELKLQKINQENQNDMSQLKTIALALGKEADTSESVLLDTISKIKLAKETAETKVTALEAEIKEIRLAAASKLVDQAVQLGLIPEALKASQLAAFENDHDGQTVILSKLIGDKEATATQNTNQAAVKEVILAGGKTGAAATTEETFDYLQKYDVLKLAKIRDEQPEQYAKLAKDYANGLRHKESK